MPRIELLGGVTVVGPDAPVPDNAFAGRRGRVALAVLAMERGRTIDEDELAEALWPRSLPPTWRPAMRSAISRVRDVLEAGGIEPAIRTRGGCVTLHLPIDVVIDVDTARREVERAERALVAGDHAGAAAAAARATALLATPLLPRETSEWAERRRVRLHHLRGRALHVQSAGLLGCGDHDGAVDAAEQLIRAEPFGEDGHRLLMRALAAGGRRAAALRAYDRCRLSLADELGIEPDAETEALHLDMLGGIPDEPQRPGGPGAVSSERDRRLLDDWWDTVARGGPPVLALSGDSGSGKVDLIGALAQRESAAGTLVVWIRPHPGSAVEDPGGTVLAASSPRVLIVVERAETAAGLDVMLALPGLASGRVGVVLGHRSDRPWLVTAGFAGVLQAFERRGMLRRLVMSPLGHDDAVRLLESITGRPADDAARSLATELAAECGGNQGLMRLRTLGLLTNGSLRAGPDGWTVPAALADEPVPRALVDAVGRWARGAPPGLIASLQRLAERGVRPRAVEVSGGESPGTDDLHLAVRCGLLADAGGGFRFVHPVIGRCWADGSLDALLAPAPLGDAAAGGETRRSHEVRSLRRRC